MGCNCSRPNVSAPAALSSLPNLMSHTPQPKAVVQTTHDAASTVPVRETHLLAAGGDRTAIVDEVHDAAKQFNAGVLKGFMGKEMPDVAKFLKNVQTLQSHLEAATSNYNKWKEHKTHLKLLYSVFKEYANALNPLGHALAEYGAVESEMYDFLDALAEMSNPVGLVYHVGEGLYMNGEDILKHMESAAQNCFHANWEQMGDDIGHVMADFVGKGRIIRLIQKGIVEGFMAKELPAVVATEADAKDVYEKLKDAISEFKKTRGSPGTWKHVPKAVKKLAQAMKPLVAAMKELGVTEEETKRLMKAIEQMETPTSLVFHVGDELRLNGKDILQHMDSATEHFFAWQWEKFGEDLGGILADLVGSPLPSSACWPFASCSHPSLCH